MKHKIYGLRYLEKPTPKNNIQGGKLIDYSPTYEITQFPDRDPRLDQIDLTIEILGMEFTI